VRIAELLSFKEKHRLLSELDLDTHLIIRFNPAFSQLAAQTFVQEIVPYVYAIEVAYGNNTACIVF
jgi:FAD synthase